MREHRVIFNALKQMNTKYDMYTHVRWDDPAQKISWLKRIVHRTNPLYSLSDSIRPPQVNLPAHSKRVKGGS